MCDAAEQCCPHHEPPRGIPVGILELEHRWSGTSTCIFDVLPRHGSSRQEVLIPVPSQGSPAICISHRIAYISPTEGLVALSDLRLACGRGMPFAAPRNQQALLHDTIWGFLFLFSTIKSMACHKDRRGSPLSRGQYIRVSRVRMGVAGPWGASPFDAKGASVEHLVDKDGDRTLVVGRKGGIYAGNVPPTTARFRNRLSCRCLRRASEAMAAKRDVPKQRHEALGGFRTSCRVIGQGPGACQKPLLPSSSGLPRHSIRQNVRRPNQVTTCGPSETRVVDEQPSHALLTGQLSLGLTRVEPLELKRTNETTV